MESSKTSSFMELDDHPKPGFKNKNIDSSSSSSVTNSTTERNKDLVSSFQQDHKNVKNCPCYMLTGTCSFGMKCGFNHPVWKAIQFDGAKQEKEESWDQTKHIDCKANLASGEFVDDATRISWYSKERTETESVELNFLDLPKRPGERDCEFYMQNAACPHGTDCRFNHPEPTFDPESNILWHMGTSSQYPEPGTFEVMLSQNFSNPRTQSSKPASLQEYPDRPGRPLCDFFIKKGFCKYKSSCRYHHPKKRASSSTMSSHASSKMTSPPTPENALEKGICKFYVKFGTCKYGSACKFNHPDPSR